MMNNFFAQISIWNGLYTLDNYWFSIYIVIEGILVSLFIYWLIQNIQNTYEKNLVTQEVKALAEYNHSLEHIQDNVLKLKHDYQNLLLGLSSIIDEMPEGSNKEYIVGLIDYSKEKLIKSI